MILNIFESPHKKKAHIFFGISKLELQVLFYKIAHGILPEVETSFTLL